MDGFKEELRDLVDKSRNREVDEFKNYLRKRAREGFTYVYIHVARYSKEIEKFCLEECLKIENHKNLELKISWK